MKQCSICVHPERDEIEKQLYSGTSFRDIAGQFEISKSALARHKERHVSKVAEDSPEAIVNCVATAIPLVEGDLTTKALMGITNLGPLSIVLSMKELGYKSRQMRDDDQWIWELNEEAESMEPEETLIPVTFLQNWRTTDGERYGSQQRAWLPASVATDLARQGICILREGGV